MANQERLRELLQAFREDRLQDAEKEEISDPAMQEALAMLMQEEPLDSGVDASRWESRIRSILDLDKDEDNDENKGRNNDVRVPPVRRLYRWTAAAAILLLVVGGAAYFRIWQKPAPDITENQTSANDIPPGGNKAVLTLGNGSKITLDSAENGVLAQQGAVRVVKLSNGQLTYTPSSGKSEPVLYNTMTTPKGGQYRLTLPDGSEVWLNAASSITYPTAFTGPQREVTITGEAYFEVVHKEKQPFRVKAGNALIEDLGTHFNINAYPDESAMRTTLLEGAVRISHPGGTVLMKPGQQARSEASGKISVVSGADLEETMAWKNGLFQFNRADIRTVMRQIARWYDVEISYEGPVPDDLFWGKLPREANVSQVLRVLQKTQVHFRIEGKKIIVTQ